MSGWLTPPGRYGRDGVSYAGRMLGLPNGTRGCLFDLDGVLTKTAKVHDAAWKEMLDGREDDPPGTPTIVADLAELLDCS